MSLSGPPPEPSPADDLFARWLDQRERGEDPDFAQFCAAWPEHAQSLRFLHDNWRRLEEMLRSAPEDRGPHDFRYQIGEVIARGGMGVVMRAFDRVLQRTVAIKLSHKNTADPRAESRFLDEARITGQLDHPGIVPIHDLGQDAERRSYFTMPLVRGRTLAAIIASLHAGEPEWSLPRVLSVLLAVCDAVASAHAKGVIHRDLKPGNVMVGRFGEVYVMDWGLARVMHEADRRDIRLREVVEPQSSVHSGRRELAGDDPDSPLITMDGDVVGTPAYMAPEQARGEVERVGPRADVYAAGAMLYHAIAGEMPYVGRSKRISSRTVLARVLDGPPRRLAEVKPGAPAELVAICEQAMARDPEDRYAGMRELAADLRAFLELRVVRAYGGGTWTELGKWVRRNRALAAAGAGLVLALAAGLVVSLSFRKSAVEQAARAEAGYTASLDAVDQMMLRVAEARLDQVPGAEQVRRQLLQDARALYERFLAEQGNRPELLARVARTHFELARMHRLLGELDDAEKQGRTGIARYEELLAANPDDINALYWRAYCWFEVGTVLLQRGRSEPGEEAVLRAQSRLSEALERHPRERRLLARQVDVVHALGQIAYRAGRREPALELQKQAVQRAEALLLEAKDLEARLIVAVEYQTLGGMLEDMERYAEAEQPLRQAVSAYEALLAETPRETRFRQGLARSLMSMDFVLRSKDDLAGARAAVDRALELFRDLAAEFPRRPEYHSMTAAILSNRATMLQNRGQHTEALADLEEAIRLQRLALAQVPDHKQFRERLANLLGNRLVSLQALGRWRELGERAEEMAALGPDSMLHLQFAGVFQLMAAGLAGADQALPAEEAERQREELVQRGVARLRAAMALGFHAWRRLGTSEFDGVREHPAVRALLDDLRRAELAESAAAADGRLPAHNFERTPADASGTAGTPASADAGEEAVAMTTAGYREIAPHPSLRPYVECFWVRRDPHGGVHRILPDGCLDLLFDAREVRAWLIGAMTRPHEFVPEGPVDIVAVRFHPGGARPFVRDDVAQFTDGRLGLEQLSAWGRQAAAAMAGAGDGPARIAAIQQQLLRLLPRKAPDAIDGALAELRQRPAAFRVAAAAADAGVSRQWFARAVQARTGLGPKELQRILRLRAVLPALQQGSGLTSAALAGGYADHAHLCRDARTIAGASPGLLARRPS